MTRFKRIFRYVMLYISFISTISFALFIFEESMQVMMFSIWPAKDANEWQLVWNTSELMEKTNATLNGINNWLGWTNPLGYLAYRSYAKATSGFIQSYRKLALSRGYSPPNRGTHIRRHFYPKRLFSGNLKGRKGVWLQAGRYYIWGKADQLGKELNICIEPIDRKDPYRVKEVPCES